MRHALALPGRCGVDAAQALAGAGTDGALAAPMQTSERRWPSSAAGEPAPDVATTLCHQIHQPLTCLLASLERAQEALRRCAPDGADQDSLRVAHCLADAQATARHVLSVVAGVHGDVAVEPRRTRRLDLRAALRAAAAMVQSAHDGADITVDAPEPAWVDGVDTRLVHVFMELFAEALADEPALVATVRCVGRDVTVEGWRVGPSEGTRGPSVGPLSRALARAVVGHVVALHGGRLELWPSAAAGICWRVTLPAARRIQGLPVE